MNSLFFQSVSVVHQPACVHVILLVEGVAKGMTFES